MKKALIVVLAMLIIATTAQAAGRYEIIGKSATTVISTSAGGNLGLFTRISGSNTVKYDAYTLRIRQPQYRGLDLLVSEMGSGPGNNGYDTNYAGETWESPVNCKDKGVHVNLTCTVSDLVVEATFYQLKE